jgi:hypothetical protein
MIITGKCSTFGGPLDTGVSPTEGLALIEEEDLALWWYRHLFLREQPRGTAGLARRLDPDAYYCAMRWNYAKTPRKTLRRSVVRVSANGVTIFVRPVDWGPHERTGRTIDLSPGAAAALRVKTDNIVSAELVLA